MQLDTITMLIALGIVSAGFAIAMFLVWRFLLHQKPLLLWSIAIGCNGAGVVLVALRDRLPDLLSILAANLLIIGCCGLIWTGTSHYRGVKPCYRTLLLSILFSIPVYVWFTWVEPSIVSRIIICRSYSIFYLLGAMTTLLHTRGNRLTLMEKATIAGLLTNAVLPLLGIVTQLTDLSYVAPMYHNAIIRFSATAGLIGITVWSLAAMLMILERVVAEKEKAEAEKLKLKSQHLQLQKVESLGRMAGAIAHKFNNLLGAVMGNLDLAMGKLPANTKPMEYLEEAMKAAGRAAEVSGLMLTYLGLTPARPEPLDLAATCQQCLGALRSAMPQDVELLSDLPPAGPVIKVNKHQFQQLLTNLVTNAWESVGEHQGAVRLAVATVAATEIPAMHRFPLDWQPTESHYACLEVSDNGCGIAESDIDKLCDPFFTTKFTGRGLGLAVTLGIVRAHNGALAVESSGGNGSILRIFFPVSPEIAPSPPDRAAVALQVTAQRVVLLVEDEQLVRQATADMLGYCGFTVLQAGDGTEAVELFRQHRDTICCVLSDMTMPRMDGWATLTELRRLAPGIPVILSSGYDQAQVMAEDHCEWPQVFLGKPYRLNELDEALKKALAPDG